MVTLNYCHSLSVMARLIRVTTRRSVPSAADMTDKHRDYIFSIKTRAFGTFHCCMRYLYVSN